jgi:tetratricopeptide (TPR) repeat protein
MSDIKSLEEQWRRYRRKRLSKVLLAVLGLLVVLGTPLGYYVGKGRDASQKKEISLADNRTAPVENDLANKNTAIPVPAPLKTREAPESKAGVQGTQSKKKDMVISFSDANGQVEQVTDQPSRKKMELQINDAKSDRIVKEIEKRFPDTQGYDDAIYLARYYYEKHKYAKAEHWAMQANTIDSSQEESWLLYAKSKAKQGHRVSALRILQAYFDQTGSLRAKDLIDRIRRGKKF